MLQSDHQYKAWVAIHLTTVATTTCNKVTCYTITCKFKGTTMPILDISTAPPWKKNSIQHLVQSDPLCRTYLMNIPNTRNCDQESQKPLRPGSSWAQSWLHLLIQWNFPSFCDLQTAFIWLLRARWTTVLKFNQNRLLQHGQKYLTIQVNLAG